MKAFHAIFLSWLPIGGVVGALVTQEGVPVRIGTAATPFAARGATCWSILAQLNGPGLGCTHSQASPMRAVRMPVSPIFAASVASKGVGPGCTPNRPFPALALPSPAAAATRDPPPHASADTATAAMRVPATRARTRGDGRELERSWMDAMVTPYASVEA